MIEECYEISHETCQSRVVLFSSLTRWKTSPMWACYSSWLVLVTVLNLPYLVCRCPHNLRLVGVPGWCV